jgi:membrane protease YdiL (CAAX protease family)
MSVRGVDVDGRARRQTAVELSLYFGICFLITWGLGAALLFARPQLEAVVGPMGQINHHWLYFIAVFAPTLAAVGCSLMFGGWGGLKALALRFVRPVRPLWVAIAILLWPLWLAAYALATHTTGVGGQVDLHALAFGVPTLAFTTLVLFTDPGGFGEETGWRGYALPRLLRLFRPATASAVLGIFWGLWHLPAFFVSGLAQSQFGLGWFLLGCVAECVVWTWIYLNANGNVVVAGVIPHLMWNLVFDAHVLSGDVIRLETIALSLLALALLVCLGPGLRGWKAAAIPAR